MVEHIERETQNTPMIVRRLRPVRMDEAGLPSWVAESTDVLARLGFPMTDPTIPVERVGQRIYLSRPGDAPLYLPTAPDGLQVIASSRAAFTDIHGDYAEADARVFQASPLKAIVAIVHSRDEVELMATDPVGAKLELQQLMEYWIGTGLEVDAHFASH
jgi:hypothetical protein